MCDECVCVCVCVAAFIQIDSDCVGGTWHRDETTPDGREQKLETTTLAVFERQCVSERMRNKKAEAFQVMADKLKVPLNIKTRPS